MQLASTRLRASLFALCCFFGSQIFLQAETSVVDGFKASVFEFNGPDQVHLDPSTAIIAVDVFGAEDLEVNGVTFLGDADAGTVENNGVEVTVSAANSITAWAASPAFVGADQDSADNLSRVMESIRWEGAPNPVTVEVTGLPPNTSIEVQLLTNEGGDRARHWDIGIGDIDDPELVIDSYTSEGIGFDSDLGEEGFYTGENSFGAKFVAQSGADGTLNVIMQQHIGGLDPTGADNNPILQGLVLHTAVTSPYAEGLVGYWTFDGTLEDAAPAPFNTSHGTRVGGEGDSATFESGKFGSGIKLDGIDEHVEVNPDDESFFDGVDDDLETIGFTLSTWFRVDSFDKSWQCLAGKGEGANWRLARRGTESGLAGVGGSGDTPTGPTAVDDGELHLAILRSIPDEGVQLFIDGELEGEQGPPTLDDGDLTMLIGENPGALGRTWNGLIDDFAFWERPLSDDEIEGIWKGGAGVSIGELLGQTLPDADQDGMPDFYEEEFEFLSSENPDDAALDEDEDTLTNLEEYNGGTAPDKKDTDEDGLDDNVETNTGTFVDATNTGTSPTKSDSDKDGLLDGVETNSKTFVSATDTGTDPNIEDSDGDNIGDGTEVAAGTDPTDPADFPGCETPIFNGGTITEIAGPDDLHLDPSSVLIAVDVYGDQIDEGRVVNGVTFFSDRCDDCGDTEGLLEVNGITYKSESTNFIDGWAAPPNFIGGTDDSADQLAGIMEDIRWSSAPSPIITDIEGLAPGAPVEVQLLFNEGGDRNRHWDVGVEDELAADNITSEGCRGETGGVWTSDNSFAFTFEATPSADGILNILMQQQIDGEDPSGTDNNPILQAVIVHQAGPGTLFAITNVEKSDTEITLTWASSPGREYAVEYASDVSQEIWIELDDGVQSEGDETSFTDDDPARVSELAEGWYRIRDNP